MSDDTRDDRYLWDRSGPRDEEVARLEGLLAPLGHSGRLPEVPRRRGRSRAPRMAARVWAAAAAVVILAGAAWMGLSVTGREWMVDTVSGSPVVDGAAVGKAARLRVGEYLVTDATSRARIAVGRIGRVEVDPDTRLRLVEAKGREHRMSLERGTIHAQIWAPPKIFFVNTPSAVAVDLGCAYTLQVDDSGAGLLRVTAGWVSFESSGRESFIPVGAMCATRLGVGPGTPRYEDAPSGFGEALATLDFGAAGDPGRAAALDLILTGARPRDAMTLWHLLSRGPADERARVCERMSVLAPPPGSVSCAAVLAGDRAARDQWWDSLGLEDAAWWRLWKKKFS